MAQDLAGNDLKPGDFVAYAALWDRCAVLKYGIVTKIAERDSPNYAQRVAGVKIATVGVLSVDRIYHGGKRDWDLQKNGKETVLGFTDRMLSVEAKQVPERARRILREAYATRTKI